MATVTGAIPVGVYAPGGVLGAIPVGVTAPGAILEAITVGVTSAAAVLGAIPVGVRTDNVIRQAIPVGVRVAAAVVGRIGASVLTCLLPAGIPDYAAEITVTAGLEADPAPPGAPATGARYLVPASATGAWSGHDLEIATWSGSAWSFVAPVDGQVVWVRSTDKTLTWSAS